MRRPKIEPDARVLRRVELSMQYAVGKALRRAICHAYREPDRPGTPFSGREVEKMHQAETKPVAPLRGIDSDAQAGHLIPFVPTPQHAVGEHTSAVDNQVVQVSAGIPRHAGGLIGRQRMRMEGRFIAVGPQRQEELTKRLLPFGRHKDHERGRVRGRGHLAHLA